MVVLIACITSAQPNTKQIFANCSHGHLKNTTRINLHCCHHKALKSNRTSSLIGQAIEQTSAHASFSRKKNNWRKLNKKPLFL